MLLLIRRLYVIDNLRKGDIKLIGQENLVVQSIPKPVPAEIVPRGYWLLHFQIHNLAKRVVGIYKTRMQIEEGYRDMKSHRYGLGFGINLSKLKRRISVLVLLSALANLIATLIDWTVASANKHRRYQANSVSNRRVLSYHFTGLRAFADKHLRL